MSMSYYSYKSLEMTRVASRFNVVSLLRYAMDVLLDIRTNVSKNSISKSM